MPNINANGGAAQLLAMEGAATIGVQVTGTWTGTLAFQGSVDGGQTWFAVPGQVPSGGTSVTQTTANGQWQVPTGGIAQFQVVATAWTSGTASVALLPTIAPPAAFNPAAHGAALTQVQGAAATGAPIASAGNPLYIAGLDTGNTLRPLKLDPSGNLNVVGTNADGGSISAPLMEGVYESSSIIRSLRAVNAPFADVSIGRGVAAVNIPGLAISGNLTAQTGSVTLNPVGAASVVGVGITGSGATVTYNFEGSVDGTNWVAINAITLNSHVTAQTATANGNWWIPCSGLLAVRVRQSNAGMTGTATIALQAGIGSLAGTLDSKGNQVVSLVGPDSNSAISSRVPSSDAIGQTADNGLSIVAYAHAFDDAGLQWNRARPNTSVNLLASTGRVGTTTTANQTNFNARGIILVLNVTANPGGAQTLTLSVNGIIGGNSFVINTGAANAFGGGTGSSVLVFYPGASTAWTGGTEHLVFQTVIPRIWTATVAHSGAGSWTYTLDVAYIL